MSRKSIGLAKLAASFGMLAGCVFSLAAQANPATINNDTFWKDTSGNPIYSQGGGVLKVGDTYYWYGVKYDGAVSYAANPTSRNRDAHFNAVTIYSSKDLAHWKFEGKALSAAIGGPLDPANWVGRLGVVYNSNTRQYVLISQKGSPTGGGVMFATSSTPVGPFEFDHVQRQITNVVTAGTGDQTVFTDDDGKSYLVFSNAKGRRYSYVAPISARDSLSIEPAIQIAKNPVGREGNAMFKYDGVYYFCSSDLHGWNASATYCRQSSTGALGPYGAEFTLNGTAADFSHVSQNGFYVPVKGSQATTILFAGDRWSDFAGNGLGYNQWMPISFSNGVPTVQSLSQFNLDARTGTWTVGIGNNYVLNPGFEADRVSQTELAGWQSSSSISPNVNSNATDRPRTGRWSTRLYSGSDYAGRRYQYLTLPNGTYTLEAWVRSGGGQRVARIYVRNYGGPELDGSANRAIPNWTRITIPNIKVTNGRAEIGLDTVARAGQWVAADDFSMTLQVPGAGRRN